MHYQLVAWLVVYYQLVALLINKLVVIDMIFIMEMVMFLASKLLLVVSSSLGVILVRVMLLFLRVVSHKLAPMLLLACS